jgi:hypothetical protein
VRDFLEATGQASYTLLYRFWCGFRQRRYEYYGAPLDLQRRGSVLFLRRRTGSGQADRLLFCSFVLNRSVSVNVTEVLGTPTAQPHSVSSCGRVKYQSVR